jgi:SAM-dependent methyltransferase
LHRLLRGRNCTPGGSVRSVENHVADELDGHPDAAVKRFPLVIGDITKRTQFKDGAFDAILTLSVLEHLSELHGAFDEMSRVLRNGGEMLHMFGPAWSCAYGHHIYADPSDALLNFSLRQMPAHIHLLCSRQEIVDYYPDAGYPDKAWQAALHWFFEAPYINRVFYDDYMAIFEEDRLQIVGAPFFTVPIGMGRRGAAGCDRQP